MWFHSLSSVAPPSEKIAGVMLTILPLTVCTSVAQPTEQYGHTLGVVFGSLMRSSCVRASVGARLAPRPARPPSAVPVAMPEDTFKKFRRETSINTPIPVGLVEKAFAVPVRPSWFELGEPAERGAANVRWHAGIPVERAVERGRRVELKRPWASALPLSKLLGHSPVLPKPPAPR